MEISKRIQLVIKMTNHSPASFADALDINRSSISHIVNGRNKPGIDFLEKVLVTFPKVDARWLLTGQQSLVADAVESRQEPQVQIAKEEPSNVELYNSDIERIVVFYKNNRFKEYRQA